MKISFKIYTFGDWETNETLEFFINDVIKFISKNSGENCGENGYKKEEFILEFLHN